MKGGMLDRRGQDAAQPVALPVAQLIRGQAQPPEVPGQSGENVRLYAAAQVAERWRAAALSG